MQMPDYCFGEQFPVCCNAYADSGADAFALSEIALPDVCVLWQMNIYPHYVSHHNEYIRLGLAETIPKDETEFMTLSPLIPGFGMQDDEPRKIRMLNHAGLLGVKMRKVIETQGKKLALMAHSLADNSCRLHVIIVVSRIPEELPNWLP